MQTTSCKVALLHALCDSAAQLHGDSLRLPRGCVGTQVCAALGRCREVLGAAERRLRCQVRRPPICVPAPVCVPVARNSLFCAVFDIGHADSSKPGQSTLNTTHCLRAKRPHRVYLLKRCITCSGFEAYIKHLKPLDLAAWLKRIPPAQAHALPRYKQASPEAERPRRGRGSGRGGQGTGGMRGTRGGPKSAGGRKRWQSIPDRYSREQR